SDRGRSSGSRRAKSWSMGPAPPETSRSCSSRTSASASTTSRVEPRRARTRWTPACNVRCGGPRVDQIMTAGRANHLMLAYARKTAYRNRLGRSSSGLTGGFVMGLWDKLRGELIDIIEWTEPPGSELLAYRFPRYNNEILQPHSPKYFP